MNKTLSLCIFVIEKIYLYGNRLSYSFLERCQVELLHYVNTLDPVVDHKLYFWLDYALNEISAVLFG